MTTCSPNKVLLICYSCKSNTKPRLVWIENGNTYFAGRCMHHDVAKGEMVGKCSLCNREWRYEFSLHHLTTG